MSKALRKLTLNRETLIPLHNNELAEVNGGTLTPTVAVSRATFIASVRACQFVSGLVAQQAQASFTGVRKVVQTAKKVTGTLLRPPAHTPSIELVRFGPGVSK